MNSLDTRDPLERMLCEALQADAERAPQLPMEWIAPTTSSITDAWIDGPLVLVDVGDEQPVGQRRRPPWPLVATAAAVIAIVVAALVLVIADDDTKEVPAGPPSTVNPDATQAEQIARAFIETRWSDPDQALSYVSHDVTCSPASRCLPNTGHPALPTPAETSRTADSLRLEAALFEALGDKIVNVRCEQQDTSASGISVRCTYDYHTFRSEELGRGPFELGPDVFVVRDRKIVSISPFLRFGLGEYFRPTWDDFRIWLSIQHPDDIALMYEGDAPDQPLHGIKGWLFSEQSIALWGRYTLEYATDRAQMGNMGLPPEGATPSTPDNGELVVGLHGMTGHGETAIYVYADGRLISHRHRDVGPPGAATAISTGYLVQRLTPEGVELLRAEVLSSGLFEEYHEVDGIPCRDPGPKRRSPRQRCLHWLAGADAGADRLGHLAPRAARRPGEVAPAQRLGRSGAYPVRAVQIQDLPLSNGRDTGGCGRGARRGHTNHDAPRPRREVHRAVDRAGAHARRRARRRRSAAGLGGGTGVRLRARRHRRAASWQHHVHAVPPPRRGPLPVVRMTARPPRQRYATVEVARRTPRPRSTPFTSKRTPSAR